jgi:pimeloyl-ACP methyl ester carboxylesterase
MLFFGWNGYRVIAHDRRGHGQSDPPWEGNNVDQYADDAMRFCLGRFDAIRCWKRREFIPLGGRVAAGGGGAAGGARAV